MASTSCEHPGPKRFPVANLHSIGHLLPFDVVLHHPRAFDADETLHAGVHGLVEDVHDGVEASCSEAKQPLPLWAGGPLC